MSIDGVSKSALSMFSSMRPPLRCCGHRHHQVGAKVEIWNSTMSHCDAKKIALDRGVIVRAASGDVNGDVYNGSAALSNIVTKGKFRFSEWDPGSLCTAEGRAVGRRRVTQRSTGGAVTYIGYAKSEAVRSITLYTCCIMYES